MWNQSDFPNSCDKPPECEYTAENRLSVVKQGEIVLMAAMYDADNNRVFQIDNIYDWEDCYGDEVLIPKSQRMDTKDSPKERFAELIPNGADAKGYTLTEHINDINQEYTKTLAEYHADNTIRQSYVYGNDRLAAAKAQEKGYHLYD